MTDQELKDLVASLAEDTKQLRQVQLESERTLTEERRKTEEERRKTEEERRKTEQMLRELGRQIGGLGNKFGSFTEGLAMPSVQRLLFERFGVEEIKSHLRSEAVQQMLTMLNRFRSIFPEYAAMKLFGIIAAADASADALREAQEAGLYAITFEDDLMNFHDENGFLAKAY
jgi:hypothetical protein